MDIFLKTMANIISITTILSSAFLKVPQILSVRKKKSAEGIYLQAMLLEITSFTIVTLYNHIYNYSLLTYLEYPIILLQSYVLLYYVLYYKRLLKAPVVPLGVMLYLATVFGFVFEILPHITLSYVLPLCTPMSGFAKVSYMYGIIKAGNADSVSLTTWVISVGTNLSRLFTVYLDSGDLKLMINLFISAMLSVGVLCTAAYYQNFHDSLLNYELKRKKQKSNIETMRQSPRHHNDHHKHYHDD